MLLFDLVLSLVHLLLLPPFFVSGDGDPSLFLASIVSPCDSSAVFAAGVADSIGTSMANTTDFSDLFDSEMLDTTSVLIGVFE